MVLSHHRSNPTTTCNSLRTSLTVSSKKSPVTHETGLALPKGISRHRLSRSFQVQVQHNGKTRHLGYTRLLPDAIARLDEWHLEHPPVEPRVTEDGQRCAKCQTRKSPDAFSGSTASWCRSCRTDYQRERRQTITRERPRHWTHTLAYQHHGLP